MKIAELPIKANIYTIVNSIKKLLKSQFIIYKKDYEALISLYDEEVIYEAIDSIYAQDKLIIAPTAGIYGKILRYLEYGGQGVEQKKLLSKASRNIIRKVSEDYVI